MVRSPLRGQKTPQSERHANDHGFVQQEQNQRAAKYLAQRFGRVNPKEQRPPELRHRRRAKRQHKAENEGKREHSRAQGDSRPGGQPGDAQNVKTGGDSRAHR